MILSSSRDGVIKFWDLLSGTIDYYLPSVNWFLIGFTVLNDTNRSTGSCSNSSGITCGISSSNSSYFVFVFKNIHNYKNHNKWR